ncbi:MAG: alpha/beta hydrolase, partial [Planctomycetota bacterium]
ATIAWLKQDSIDRVVIVGESIGSGVAVEMAKRHKPAALIIQAGFSSTVDAAAAKYPFLPVSWMLWDRYDSVSKIPEIQCPYLHIHGSDDGIIGIDLGRKLFEAAPEPKEFHEFPGRGHNDLLLEGDAYYQRIDRFLKKALGP